MRMILPFGLNLKIGDVISVAKNGEFRLETKASTLFHITPGVPRTEPGKVDLARRYGTATSVTFREAGTASTLFPQLPSAAAGFDIAFGSADGWVLAVTGRALETLDEIDRFRAPILDAYQRKVWKADWALVTAIFRADRMTLLASKTSDTKIALNVNGQFTPGAGNEVKLTAGVSIVQSNQDITQCIWPEPMPVACSALRVRDDWWSGLDVGTLEYRPERKFADASPQEFWENVDELPPGAKTAGEL
jgi:hypothetical protein